MKAVTAMLALGLGLAPTMAPAAPGQPAAPVAAPLLVKGAQQFDMQAASGRSYRIFVSVPHKPPPPSGYGVLYVLDGNAMFLTAMETVRAMERRPDVPRDLATVVVGIGYPDGVEIGPARTLDLTPPGSGDPRVKVPSGGADAFLDFIEDQLKPQLARHAQIDPARQALFGHSFGGLFVLHSLLRKPDAFAVRVAASPSIWFDRADISTRVTDALANRTPQSAPLRLLLSAGQYEQALSPLANAQPDVAKVTHMQRERAQVDRSRALATALEERTAVDVRFDEIASEDHGTVIPGAISRAVSFMLMPQLEVPPVPSASSYWQMTPEQRYDLRMWVRQLPDRKRIPWLTRLRDTLHDGLSKEQLKTLHDERNGMDAEQGSKPHEVNAAAR
ncbi:MAG: alpha/beta hydrolase-fold protein [Stenotrophomonas sp.]